LEDDFLNPRTGGLADEDIGIADSMFDDDDFTKAGGGFDDDCINPATGLPMVGGIGGVDVAGNPYGTSGDDFSSFDDTFSTGMDDTFSSGIDDTFSSSFDDSFGSGFSSDDW
jgi:hypothetical protein